MAKIVPVMGVAIALNIMLFIFAFNGADCAPNCDLADMNTESNDMIWTLFTNPSDFASSAFWERLFGSTFGILSTLTTAGGLLALGAAIYFKDINIAFISLSIFVAGFVISTWARVWTAVNNNVLLGASSGGAISGILVGMGLFINLWFLIDWGRGR